MTPRTTTTVAVTSPWNVIKTFKGDRGLRVVVSELPLPKPHYSVAIRREREDETLTGFIPIFLRGKDRTVQSVAEDVSDLLQAAEDFIQRRVDEQGIDGDEED